MLDSSRAEPNRSAFFKSEQSVTISFDHASDDCNRRRGALLLRVSVGDYNPHRKTECPPPPTEAGDIGDLVINGNNPNYNLISRNCMQISIRALLKGDFGKGDRTYKRILSLFSLQPIPNVSYNSLWLFNNVAVPMYGLSYAYFILSQKFIQSYLRPVII